MIFFYGYNTKIFDAIETNLLCPACNKKSVFLFTSVKYATFMFVPFFPYRKDKNVVCSSCNSSLNTSILKNLNPSVVEEYFSRCKTPLWSFTGIIILVILLLYGNFSSSKTSYSNSNIFYKTSNFKVEPCMNCIAIIKNTKDRKLPYTFAKIISNEEDTVKLQFSMYKYSSQLQANSSSNHINHLSYFPGSIKEYSLEEFKNLAIIEIIPSDRKNYHFSIEKN